MNKPKEFWIYNNGEVPMLVWFLEDKEEFKDRIQGEPDYHAIEYQAYQELTEQNAKLQSALDVAVEALNYYGCADKYIIHKNGKHFGVPLERGEKARNVLSKIEELLK